MRYVSDPKSKVYQFYGIFQGNVYSVKWSVKEIFGLGDGKSGNCLTREMSDWGPAWSGKCLVGEVSSQGELSVGELSVGELGIFYLMLLP